MVIPAAALSMDQLHNFGFNPGLPRAEFVNILKLYVPRKNENP